MIPGPLNCIERSALLGLEFAPNCSGVSTSGAPLRTNELGLRDEPIADDGARRILIVGDSCTFGWDVPQQAAYPQQLQQLLDQRYSARRFRVINAGFPGYTSLQGLRYLRERGLALKPEIAVIAFGFNDAAYGRRTKTCFAIRGDFSISPAARRLDRIPFDLLAMGIPPAGSPGVGGAPARVRPRGVPAIPGRERRPRDRRRNASVHPGILAEGPGVGEYGEAAEAVALERGIPFLRYDGPRMDFAHPTREGYAALAGALLDELLTTGELPPPAGRHRLGWR